MLGLAPRNFCCRNDSNFGSSLETKWCRAFVSFTQNLAFAVSSRTKLVGVGFALLVTTG